MAKASDTIIGIDLGTTNSLVACADEAGPRLLPGPDDGADFLLPSVVHIDPMSSQATVGAQARAQAIEKSTDTIYSVKRLMGRGFDELAIERERLPYKIVSFSKSEENRDVAAIEVGSNRFTPPEVSAMILRELKSRAEAQLGQRIDRAVITVPAQFDDAQRQATRDAGKIAGLEVVRIINEPTAAALAYGLDRGERSMIAVYDFGGGTFDISILRLGDGMFEVYATNGDTHLGGDDFDQKLIELFTSEIHEQFGVDISSAKIKQQLRTLAENTKQRLGEHDQAHVEIAIGEDDQYKRTVKRDEFEEMIKPLIERTIESCSRALKSAELNPSQIDQVVMVGGSTRVPLVRKLVGEVFQCKPYTAINPEHVVALGAAVQANILAGGRHDLLLLDVTPLSLGIETLGGAIGKLIPANVRIPCQATETFTTFQDGQTKVKISVLQGERELAKDCRSLGVFELQGIPPMPAGIPKIDVTFLIDQNGVLNVSAKEQRSGQVASVQIIPSHGLTQDEVLRMTNDAVTYAHEDMTAHHLIDVKTTTEFDLNKANKMLEKFGSLLNPQTQAQLIRAAADLREFAKESDDPVAINQQREKFNHMTIPLAELAVAASLQIDQEDAHKQTEVASDET